jgi:hypothetical protein
MANDAFNPDETKAELAWAIQTAIESPAERAGAIDAQIEGARELYLYDAENLVLAILRQHNLIK